MAFPVKDPNKIVEPSENPQSKNGVGINTATREDQRSRAGLTQPKISRLTDEVTPLIRPQDDLPPVLPPARRDHNIGLPDLPNETAALANETNNPEPSLDAENNPNPSEETTTPAALSDDDDNTGSGTSGLPNTDITVPVPDYRGGIDSQISSLNNPSRRWRDPPPTSADNLNSTTNAPSNTSQEIHSRCDTEGAVSGQDPHDSSQPRASGDVSIGTKRSQGSNPSKSQQGPTSPSAKTKKKRRKNHKRKNKNKRNKKPSTHGEDTSNGPLDHEHSRNQQPIDPIPSTSQSAPEESQVGPQVQQYTVASCQASEEKTDSRPETTRNGYTGGATSLNTISQTRRIFAPPTNVVNEPEGPIQVSSVLQERRETRLDVHAPIQLATATSMLNLILLPQTDGEPETVLINMIQYRSLPIFFPLQHQTDFGEGEGREEEPLEIFLRPDEQMSKTF